MAPVLAFALPNNVVEASGDLDEHADFPEEAESIHSQVFRGISAIYRSRLHRGRREQTFAVEVWHVYHPILQDQHGANNNIERWRRSFTETCSAAFFDHFPLLSGVFEKTTGYTQLK